MGSAWTWDLIPKGIGVDHDFHRPGFFVVAARARNRYGLRVSRGRQRPAEATSRLELVKHPISLKMP